MNYPSMRIEGAILSPDIVERLEDAPGQKPVDFGFDSTTKVKDEIVRAWADAQDYWRIYQRKLESIKADSPATTETRQQWIVPFLSLLGYQLEYQSRGVELNGKLYAISHRVTNHGYTPVHIIGCNEPSGLDRKPELAVLRMSAHAMLQEYLNLQDELYGIVTNGRSLRLLRDSSRLVKLTYLEFDLDRIFTDGLFADFAILFRILHATRLPATPESSAESLIERYHQDSLDSGARIRDGLSYAVEHAIRNFANGFLTHPDNNELRELVSSGQLKPDKYYQHLLRLIYRLLFLMVIEERDLVYPKNANSSKRSTYDKFYSLRRLRNLSEKRYLADKRRHDHWQSLLSTFHLFEADGPGDKLGVAPLAGDLFDPNAIGILGRCKLGNDSLLGCLRLLSLYSHPDTGQLIRVNYGALNVEEFGSVYEGLLEYDPVFVSVGNKSEFSFAKGDARSTTGSHYTPDDLVQPLIKHSLDYLIANKLKEANPEKALLSLRVADISCGSGHILLAAARRIAAQLATVRTGEEQPSPTAFRTAVRDVIRECIYGVDLNPLAVELCKVALWLEAHNPGLPLNFLDHHIKCGNAIVGLAHYEELQKGIANEAFKKIAGDNSEQTKLFSKRNKDERITNQSTFDFGERIGEQLSNIADAYNNFSELPESTPEQVENKKRAFSKLSSGKHWWRLKTLSDIQTAQFFIPKTINSQQLLITDATYRDMLSGRTPLQGNKAVAQSNAVSVSNRFFHWFLEFPEVFSNCGFDCTFGNPPYLGGRKISTTYGDSYLNYIIASYPPAGKQSDYVTYFLKRNANIVSDAGFVALITTDKISQGDSRELGLSPVLKNDFIINFAKKSIIWPGLAAVKVSLFSITKREQTRRILDNKKVQNISSHFEDSEEFNEPLILSENLNKCYKGVVLKGIGFVIDKQEGDSLLSEDETNNDIILPFINGVDLNNDPNQKASRYIINFKKNSREYCERQFPRALEIIRERVKPYRDTLRTDEGAKKRWWQFARSADSLYKSIGHKKHVFARSLASKHHSLALLSSSQIFDQALVVFADDDFLFFSLVISSIHYEWANLYSSDLGSTYRYNIARSFETFPFPRNLTTETKCILRELGEAYHIFRQELMTYMKLGLTKTYNQFHNGQLSIIDNSLSTAQMEQAHGKETVDLWKHLRKTGSEGDLTKIVKDISQLRALHKKIDIAVLQAYGWDDIDPSHNFYELQYLPESDRVRYTISPEVRKEILGRLLALNHERAEAEDAESKTRKKGSSKKSKHKDVNQQELL